MKRLFSFSLLLFSLMMGVDEKKNKKRGDFPYIEPKMFQD